MGAEGKRSSIFLFPLSLNLSPRGDTFLTKEKEERAREGRESVQSGIRGEEVAIF
jgi:hypothetical protein